eukprot:c12883_g1_i1 orf=91-558(+)
MAGKIYQPWNPGLVRSSEEEEWRFQHKHTHSRNLSYDPSQWWDNSNSKVCPAYTDFQQHMYFKESQWIDGWYNPSWLGKELREGGPMASPQARVQGLCEKSEKVIHDKALPRNNDASTALVASLRACAKNKDLSRGTKIHDDILKLGLLEKCSDA